LRILRSPKVLLNGKHWRVEYERRRNGKGRGAYVVEIVHITHKKYGTTSEFYSSNYVAQVESGTSRAVIFPDTATVTYKF
jgi:hypothetical protein